MAASPYGSFPIWQVISSARAVDIGFAALTSALGPFSAEPNAHWRPVEGCVHCMRQMISSTEVRPPAISRDLRPGSCPRTLFSADAASPTRIFAPVHSTRASPPFLLRVQCVYSLCTARVHRVGASASVHDDTADAPRRRQLSKHVDTDGGHLRQLAQPPPGHVAPAPDFRVSRARAIGDSRGSVTGGRQLSAQRSRRHLPNTAASLFGRR